MIHQEIHNFTVMIRIHAAVDHRNWEKNGIWEGDTLTKEMWWLTQLS